MEILEIKCPRCDSQSKELIECESCKKIGCVKCITQRSKQWLCGDCRLGNTYQPTNDPSPLSAIFG
ncbi:MAG: hypothetical protein J4452_02405 [Candidatus Aenigmarchaeota archaeon]|nr:hypothetical protein [Candidatus Aenigmarchaeota archaeon]